MARRIMVVVEASPASAAAIEEGVQLARVQGAEVVFFHVLPQHPMPMVEGMAGAGQSERAFGLAAREQARRLLLDAAKVAHDAEVMHRIVLGQGGDEAACIAQAATKRRCHLVVVASQGRNAVMRLVTGSVIPGLISLAPMPVMVCRGEAGHCATSAAAVEPHRMPKDEPMACVAA